MFDEDKSGTIDKSELKKVMLTLGVEATNEEVEKFMQAADKDNSGCIDFDEFMTFVVEKMVTILDEGSMRGIRMRM